MLLLGADMGVTFQIIRHLFDEVGIVSQLTDDEVASRAEHSAVTSRLTVVMVYMPLLLKALTPRAVRGSTDGTAPSLRSKDRIPLLKGVYSIAFTKY